MTDNNLILFDSSSESRPAVTPREVLAIGFRHNRLLITVLLLGIMLALGAASLLPEYRCEMQILVNRERIDPLVSSQPNAAAPVQATVVSEEELNSEIQLLTSDEIMRQTVVSLGLHKSSHSSAAGEWMTRLREWITPSAGGEQAAIERATRGLASRLNVDLVKKSNTIIVRYACGDPQLGARVLDTVARLYLEKHALVHRPPGQFDFFDRQVRQYRKELADAEARLAAFPSTTKSRVVSGDTETTLAVQKLADLNQQLQQTNAAITEGNQRIATLEGQLKHASERMTTAVKKSDNGQLIMELKSTLLKLQLQRTDLLQRFQPTYRPILDLDRQIAETEAAIHAAQSTPLRDETTDRDPTYDWMRSELARARTERDSLQARAGALRAIVGESRTQAVDLNKSSIKQQELIRTVRTLQENYDLYLRKREEARIADAFDRNKILNVSLAERPTVPALPVHSPLFYAFIGIVIACALSPLSVVAAEYLNPAFRSAREAENYLSLPVFAVAPCALLPPAGLPRLRLPSRNL